ncbi:MAG TPA: hypothetical protein VMV41_12350 [Cellulomonadaceae bacterium]|nr:hypothetical protein [Cellulomonadaceae bacterium]
MSPLVAVTFAAVLFVLLMLLLVLVGLSQRLRRLEQRLAPIVPGTAHLHIDFDVSGALACEVPEPCTDGRCHRTAVDPVYFRRSPR